VQVQPEAQPQHPEHKDRPLRHAGAARFWAGLAFRAHPLGEHFSEDGKDALAQFGGCPACLRISLFLVAKTVRVGQNEPLKAFWTRIFKSTIAL